MSVIKQNNRLEPFYRNVVRSVLSEIKTTGTLLATNVSVSEPITEILGGPELFINKGSTINLTCLVRFAPEPPPIMLWSHNREVSALLPVYPSTLWSEKSILDQYRGLNSLDLLNISLSLKFIVICEWGLRKNVDVVSIRHVVVNQIPQRFKSFWEICW